MANTDMFAISPMLKPGEIEAMVGTKELLPKVQPEPPSPEQIMADYHVARTNVLKVIDDTRTALDEVSTVASAAQDTEWYETMAGILKVMLEANRDLIDMHTKIQKITDNIGGITKNIQNNLFVGSTNDLQKFIDDIRKDK